MLDMHNIVKWSIREIQITCPEMQRDDVPAFLRLMCCISMLIPLDGVILSLQHERDLVKSSRKRDATQCAKRRSDNASAFLGTPCRIFAYYS